MLSDNNFLKPFLPPIEGSPFENKKELVYERVRLIRDAWTLAIDALPDTPSETGAKVVQLTAQKEDIVATEPQTDKLSLASATEAVEAAFRTDSETSTPEVGTVAPVSFELYDEEQKAA